MKLKFDAEQQYQLDAIEAVVDLFDGQQTTTGADIFEVSGLGLLQNEEGVKLTPAMKRQLSRICVRFKKEIACRNKQNLKDETSRLRWRPVPVRLTCI
ncbi:MAG: hypothetical protein R3B60_04855 [Candidatus Paceibacterota bacterium]